jgi:hypothetical protein
MISRRTLLIAAAAALAGARALWGQMNQNDEARIRNIPDDELFASLDLQRDGLEKVRAAVEQKDYPAAYEGWAAYWPSAATRGKFIGNDGYVFSREEATRSIEHARADTIVLAADVLRHEIRGWGPQVIKHGPVVDFNADYGQS